MEIKKYRQYETLITIGLGAILIISILLVGPLSAIIFVIGVIILYLFKKKANIQDELITRVSEKASRKAFLIIGYGITIYSLGVLGTLHYFFETQPETALNLAMTWLWTAIGMWLIYLVFYDYYLWKMGGYK